MVILILIRVDFYYKAYKSKPRKKERKKEIRKRFIKVGLKVFREKNFFFFFLSLAFIGLYVRV